jgi:hypothetical protein
MSKQAFPLRFYYSIVFETGEKIQRSKKESYTYDSNEEY